jgi:hypothetical protein
MPQLIRFAVWNAVSAEKAIRDELLPTNLSSAILPETQTSRMAKKAQTRT